MATIDPAAAVLAGDGHLTAFNSEAFNALNLAPGQRLRRVDHVSDGRLVGSLVGVVEGDEFRSGHSAPFGGPDFVRDADRSQPDAHPMTDRAGDGIRHRWRCARLRRQAHHAAEAARVCHSNGVHRHPEQR